MAGLSFTPSSLLSVPYSPSTMPALFGDNLNGILTGVLTAQKMDLSLGYRILISLHYRLVCSIHPSNVSHTESALSTLYNFVA